VEDVAWTMNHAEIYKDYRSLSACLDIINSERIDPRDFLACIAPYRQSLVDIIETEDAR